jgi:hypothetical protein
VHVVGSVKFPQPRHQGVCACNAAGEHQHDNGPRPANERPQTLASMTSPLSSSGAGQGGVLYWKVPDVRPREPPASSIIILVALWPSVIIQKTLRSSRPACPPLVNLVLSVRLTD